MNAWVSAFKYIVDEPAGRYPWERRNLLAASALRSAACVAFFLAVLNLLLYAFKQILHFPDLQFISCIFLFLTMMKYQHSPSSDTNYLFEYACRYPWERRNLLAASALRSAASVAWWTILMCLLAYSARFPIFSIAWLWIPVVAFLAATAAIYYRSLGKDGRKEPHPL